MPLPNTASLQDVINKLEELQGFNQKIELASVIGSPATATDTVAQQVVKLQEIKEVLAPKVSLPNTEPLLSLVNAITPSRGFATGNYTTSSSSSNIIVTGIGFRPNVIVVSRKERINTRTLFALYVNGDFYNLDQDVDALSTSSTLAANTTTVTSDGFTINAGTQSVEFVWIAFE